MEHCVWEESYDLNPSTFACDCDKDYHIGEQLSNCKSVLNAADGLPAICNKTEYKPESALINPCNGKNYWAIVTVVLSIAFSLLSVVIIPEYFIKPELTWLLSYQSRDEQYEMSN